MTISDFWQFKKYQIIGAILGILFHSLLLIVVMNGKGIIAVFLMLFDFPLMIPMYLFHIDSGIAPFGVDILISVGGTLMYAFLGWKAQPFLARHPELFPHSVEDTNRTPSQQGNQGGENQ